MRSAGLLLAAHGSSSDPVANELVRRHGRHLADRGLFDEVQVAFHRGGPGFSEALGRCRTSHLIVVPLMTSGGYFCEVVLPRALAQAGRGNGICVTQTAPVGLHPLMADLVARRVRHLMQAKALDPTGTDVLVVGHGTPRHVHSRRATEDLATRLNDAGLAGSVSSAFLDERPGVAESFARLRRDHAIVIPFLIGGGHHAEVDIPAQLGIEPRGPERLPMQRQQAARWVLCDKSVGSYPGIVEIVVALARSVPLDGTGPADHQPLVDHQPTSLNGRPQGVRAIQP